ncbi:PREDICTED: cartilage oligomeric matrix protein isoform X2 [Trachymyrmex septentrionalis]|uniref:cartilage oligomeric matrix protein isoform X2 n=1 Tax=Trachymyrmex septentrionalis TaxID=34720 RepID=UPI00084F3B2D|nr:PREDICTED: cartilage oligomeric matrix protein isoform X2 [Trachymyrmex septentrionalis]
MRVPILLIFGLLIIYAVDGNIIHNEALTTSLQDAWYNDEFIIAISNFKNKRKSSDDSVEILLSVKYLGKTKLVLKIDRRTKRVILENLDDTGQRSASYVKVNTPLKSLILLVHQRQPNPRIDVYVDCNYKGSIPFKRTFRHISGNEDTLEGYVEVLKERKCRTKVYQTAITDVLRKEQCPDNLSDMKQPSVFEIDTSKGRFTDSNEDYQNKSTDRPKKKDHSGHSKGKSKPDEYNSSDSFSPSGETDNLDYPYGSRPPQSLISRPKKHSKSDKPKQSGSKSDKSDPYGYGKQPGSSSYNFNTNPSLTSDESTESSDESFNNPKRPGRSPYSGSSGQKVYPYPTDMYDSDESSKRVPRRGDIGIQSLDERVCQTDDQIVKTLNELINATRKLGRELELNRMETQHLRRLIENCSACRTPIVPTPPPSTCDHNSPCYPGVDCRNTPSGPQCGPCLRGYSGNGRVCVKMVTSSPITCLQRPCFLGVRCYDDDDYGYRCDRCPNGYTGDGERCERIRNPCDRHPCHPEVKCHPTYSPPYFKCGPCPPGYVGNGTVCLDANECELARPCHPGVRCMNLHPGYRCDRCPTGYTGPMTEGVGVEMARTRKQICQDIDECETNNGGCDPYSECINTEGSYRCGPCRSGYVGNQTTGCHLREGTCPDLITVCDVNAYCIAMYTNEFTCKCHVGWTGDGYFCGPDSDNDGIPDSSLNCHDRRCHADNCQTVPNSGQEDADGDGIGNACDDDADNDGVLNLTDNCWLISNSNQLDSDNDKIGDACDNCPKNWNSNQEDIDNDGEGDACDNDLDNDGIPNNQDNCINVKNSNQRDSDADGIGDVCDNCPGISNADQNDIDGDGVGDVCDTNADRDRDGIQDDKDNCPDVANPGQNDGDRDGMGDECDDDIDGDGIPNRRDNCPYVYNLDQRDLNHDGIGDACWNDNDNDTVINIHDNCPNNSLVWTTDFRKYFTIALDPYGTAQQDPVWRIHHDGAEIQQLLNSDPGIAIGPDELSNADYEGTFYVDNHDDDDDFVGFVFSYQDNRHFYVVYWKRNAQVYWEPSPFRAEADPGFVMKLVQSDTGPGEMLRNSLWHKEDTPNQVRVLWRESGISWQPRVSYRWHLLHRPKIGLIRFWVYQGTQQIIDSGNVFDSTLQGGKLGVYCFSQEMITWSDLLYKCTDTVPQIVWDQLPDNLKREVEVEISNKYQQQIIQRRMNYDF